MLRAKVHISFYYRFCRFFYEISIFQRLLKGRTKELKEPQVAHGWFRSTGNNAIKKYHFLAKFLWKFLKSIVGLFQPFIIWTTRLWSNYWATPSRLTNFTIQKLHPNPKINTNSLANSNEIHSRSIFKSCLESISSLFIFPKSHVTRQKNIQQNLWSK
jgi:hypothetical protein